MSNTAISQFGHTGMLNHTNSDEQVSNEEYEFDIKLNPELFKALHQKYGTFEIELFASDTNHVLDQYITARQNSFLTEWTKRFYFGNPKFLNEFIYKTLMKAVSDFRLAPDLTKLCFVLPKWEASPWYETFIDYFEIVEEYPKGSTKVFSIPIDHTSHHIRLRRQLMEELY